VRIRSAACRRGLRLAVRSCHHSSLCDGWNVAVNHAAGSGNQLRTNPEAHHPTPADKATVGCGHLLRLSILSASGRLVVMEQGLLESQLHRHLGPVMLTTDNVIVATRGIATSVAGRRR
jgi:hypothetical protein